MLNPKTIDCYEIVAYWQLAAECAKFAYYGLRAKLIKGKVMKRALFILLGLSALPRVAWASDFTLFFSVLSTYFVIIPFTLINLLLILYFEHKGKYASLEWAKKHSQIASVLPILGIFVLLLEFVNIRNLKDSYLLGVFIILSVLAIALLLARLPLLIYRKQNKLGEKQ